MVSVRAVVALLACVACASAIKIMSEKEVDRLEQQWNAKENKEDMDEFERARERQNVMPKFEPGKPLTPETMAQLQNGGKPAMIFVSFKSKDRKFNEEITGKYTDMLHNANMEIKTYFVEDDKGLFVIDDGGRGLEFVNFFKSKDEVLDVEWNNKKYTKTGTIDVDNSGSKKEEKSEEKKRRKKKKKAAPKTEL